MMLDTLKKNLFEYPEETREARLLFFKLFELFIVIETIHLSWYWGLYTLKIIDVVLPLGVANYIDISFMHGNNLPVWNAIIITVLAVLSYFRVTGRWGYAVIIVLFHLQYVARFSIGEIPHSANLIGLSVLSFAVGNLFFTKSEDRFAFIFGAILFFTGLGYFTAAISKLIGTGILWADGRHLWLWIGEKGTDILSREGAFSPNFLQQMALLSIPVATIILLIGFLTEFFGFLMWFKKVRPYIATAIIGMHLGITLSMNIRFDAFVIQLILIGYPWPALIHTYFSGNNLMVQKFKPWLERSV
ncbi:hypothetical protein [Gracilimonas halophila]|uniref:HTTM domain-containing protein n=1 Tax=Gracilimonas halophila TaxID=1834464 RepID=A0ABW5JMX1_9BACT